MDNCVKIFPILFYEIDKREGVHYCFLVPKVRSHENSFSCVWSFDVKNQKYFLHFFLEISKELFQSSFPKSATISRRRGNILHFLAKYTNFIMNLVANMDVLYLLGAAFFRTLYIFFKNIKSWYPSNQSS
jgi:hypothetical protein